MDLRPILKIERALMIKLNAAWSPIAAHAFATVHDDLKRGDFAAATEHAGKIDLRPIAKKTRQYVKYFLLEAATFGARIAQEKGDLFFTAGSYEGLLTKNANQFANAIETSVVDAAHEKLLQLIADAKKGELVVKEDPYHDSEGRFTDSAHAVSGTGFVKMYHGTSFAEVIRSEGFKINFDHGGGRFGAAVYLTDSYAKSREYGEGDILQIDASALKVKEFSPREFNAFLETPDAKKFAETFPGGEGAVKFPGEYMKHAGFDAVFIRTTTHNELVVFTPEKLKVLGLMNDESAKKAGVWKSADQKWFIGVSRSMKKGELVVKSNPYHDAQGRFTSQEASGAQIREYTKLKDGKVEHRYINEPLGTVEKLPGEGKVKWQATHFSGTTSTHDTQGAAHDAVAQHHAEYLNKQDAKLVTNEAKVTPVVADLHTFAKAHVGTLTENVVYMDRATGKVHDNFVQHLEPSSNDIRTMQNVPTKDSATSMAHLFKPGTSDYHDDLSVISLHTHPIDEAFSDGDWKLFAAAQTEGEMRVVTATREFTVIKTPAFMAMPWIERSGNAVLKVYNAKQDEAFTDMYAAHKIKQDAAEAAWRKEYALGPAEFPNVPAPTVEEIIDETSRRVANHFKLRHHERSLQSVAKADNPPRFIKEFQSFEAIGEERLQLISELHTARMAAWGFTSEMSALGITKYRLSAVLDGRTSAFCRMIDGTEFDVEDARASVVESLSTDDPEALKTLAPWPKQDSKSLRGYEALTSAELAERGYDVPPFHPNCRTMCVRIGQEISGEETQAGLDEQAQQEAEAQAQETTDMVEDAPAISAFTVEDFDALGIEMSPDDIEIWNTTIMKSPGEVLSDFLGVPASELLDHSEGLKYMHFDADGILKIDTPEASVGVMNQGEMHAAYDPFTNEFTMNSADFAVDTVEAATRYVKELLIGMQDTATTLGAKEVVLRAEGDASILAYEKLGFEPADVDAWHDLQSEIKKDVLSENGRLSFLAPEDPEELALLAKLLDDQSIEAFRALAEMPIADELFAGRGLDMTFDLTNPVSKEISDAILGA